MKDENLTYSTSTANRYRVPVRLWRKWNNDERQMFNGLYSAMIRQQGCMLHPEHGKMPATYWKTISWNAAFLAADLARLARRARGKST